MQSLDQIVKGAPKPSSTPTSSRSSSPPNPPTSDPLASLPSSPPQIYLNLLILEASLRSQYLALRERRRQNTFFLVLLAVWIAYFAYALFLRPREDGRGVGGSVYWVVEMGEKVALLGGVVTALLVWGTGQWERGIRWPRRWLAFANRGLRNMNTKIIVIRGPWWRELLSYLSFLFPFYLPFFPSPTGNFHIVERHPSEKRGGHRQHYQQYHNSGGMESGYIEEDLSCGGDYIRLLLLPKSFSSGFRENWDDYRTDFWEKENERRAQLRQKIRERERHIAQTEGGWFWRFGLWRSSKRQRMMAANLQRSHDSETKLRSHNQPSISSKPSQELRASSVRRGTRSESSHSRTSSRSSTPMDMDDRSPSRSSATGRPRRGSLTPSVSGQESSPQRKIKGSKSVRRGLSPLAPSSIREGVRTSSFSSDDSGVLPMTEIEKDNTPAPVPEPGTI